MFARAWQWICRLTLVLGGLLSFFAVLELLRAFTFFYRIRPALGWTFASILLLALLASLLYLIRRLVRYPRPLHPPSLPALDRASFKEKHRYTKYLIRHVQRTARNHHLSAAQRQPLLDHAEEMRDLLKHHPLHDDLSRIITQTEQEVLPIALDVLKNLAEKEIRRSVRDVMLGVTLSPYHSIDLLIVLYRNTIMVFRIADVYETTPTLRAHVFILRDVMRVVATVNFLYVGRNLIENLFAFLPWVGRVADDVGQGIGAGLFTSAAGHAAIDRCATARAWEKQAAVESLAAQTRDFLRDVRNIFTRDVLPDIKGRIMSEAPEGKAREPGFWENCQRGINNAFDATIKTASSLIPLPSFSSAETVPPVEPYAGPEAEPSTNGRRPHRRHRSTSRTPPVPRVLRTFTQRLKYTLGWNRWVDKP